MSPLNKLGELDLRIISFGIIVVKVRGRHGGPLQIFCLVRDPLGLNCGLVQAMLVEPLVLTDWELLRFWYSWFFTRKLSPSVAFVQHYISIKIKALSCTSLRTM